VMGSVAQDSNASAEPTTLYSDFNCPGTIAKVFGWRISNSVSVFAKSHV
jgi:hypothetical protein